MPTDEPTPEPTPKRELPSLSARERQALREDGLGQFDFGTAADDVIERYSELLGPPTSDETFALDESDPSIRHEDGGSNFAFGDYPDFPEYTWRYKWRQQTCWNMLCLEHGGSSADSLKFVAWDLSAFRTYTDKSESDMPDDLTGDPPLVTTKGLGVGTPWGELRGAYPGTKFSRGEGTSRGYDVGWESNCDGAICGTGRIEPKGAEADPPCTNQGDEGCPLADDARVLTVMAGEHIRPSCC